ncbi:hypothetical protein AB8Q94_16125, partial [Klebsiella pneumoniae]
GVGAGARRSQVIFLPASGILPPDSSGFVISPFLQNTVIIDANVIFLIPELLLIVLNYGINSILSPSVLH